MSVPFSIIAVASGKGGVGKSTTAANLAVALQLSGAKVGLLDADVYGPNAPLMMGIPEERPTINDNQDLIPPVGHGVKVMSIAFLVDAGKAIIWRGPMLHNLIKQFLQKVVWGDIDYLVVDLPPGTGDAPLSLVQSAPLTGAIVVTTPQEVAVSDVRRSISMFNEVKVPVIGLVENMSGFYCAELGKVVPMFHGEGGRKLSQEYSLPLLGQIPFDPMVGDAGDKGTPITISHPDSVQAKAFRVLAEQVVRRVTELKSAAPRPTIQVS